MSHVLLSVREQLFLKIILPNYHAIIDGGFDLTHLFRVKKNYPKELKMIYEIVQKHGLFILN